MPLPSLSMGLRAKYLDISPALRPATAVFPGDTPFKRSVNLSFKEGSHLDLSDIHTTLHIGAHADAPSHYHATGASIEKRDLSLYLGPCQVIEVSCAPSARIRPEDVLVKVEAPRVLFKTNSFSDPDQWKNDFNSLSPELVHELAQQGVRLIGIDTPSIDPATDKEIQSHQAIFAHDMAVLEGIVLTDVPVGLYHLIALPLKIEGADASPVRAILLPLKDDSWK